MCTGSSAVVRSLTAAAAAAGSRLSVTGSMSANTGRARSYSAALADATNENGLVIDLVAFAHADRAQRQVKAGRAAGNRARKRRADALREEPLEGRQARPERQLARAQHLEHRLLLGLAEQRLREWDERVRGTARTRGRARIRRRDVRRDARTLH